MGAFEIYRARRGEYRFRYRASTGEIVATSAAYPTKAETRTAMTAVFEAPMARPTQTDRVEGTDGVCGPGPLAAKKPPN